MKKTTSRTNNSAPNPIPAPNGYFPGRPKHTLDLTIHFAGDFVHAPVAEYKNGAKMVYSGVSGVLCGDDALKNMCRSNGIGVVRRFFRFENGGFVLMATPRDYMKLFSRALVDGKGVDLYADMAVQMVETQTQVEVPTELDSDESVGEVEVETEVDVDGQKSQVENEEMSPRWERNSPRWEPNTGRFERVEPVILGDESPVQFLGENLVESEAVDDDGQLDNGDENVDEDDGLFEINVDFGTQTQPELDDELMLEVDEMFDECADEKKKGKGKKKSTKKKVVEDEIFDDDFEDDYEDEDVEVKKKGKGKKKSTKKAVDEDEMLDSDYDYSTPSDHDDKSDESEEEEEFEEEEVYGANQMEEDVDWGEEDVCDDFVDWSSSEDETAPRKKKKKNTVKLKSFSEVDVFSPEFALGTCFSTKKLFRTAVHSHALVTKRKLVIYPNDSKRMHVKCKGEPPCSWKLHTVRHANDDAFKVREYYPVHACNETGKVNNIKSTWLAKKYLSSFACDPKRCVKGLRKEIKRDHGLNVSRQSVYRMKKEAHKILFGTEEEQIAILPDYQHEVLAKNPGSTFLLDVNSETGKFERLYVCLDACKEGFKACRPLIGVDGCHLNGEFGGVLLTAVGVDPNNNTFPIAWAVVQSETFESWSWFLSLLEIDLQMQDHGKWTWMSDKQKGLIKAFDQNFKESANRFCVKHLHGNMKRAGFTGSATKEALWNLATSTTMAQYDRRLQELEELNPGAAAWLQDKSQADYCRAFFSTEPKCDMLLNNGCETFNSTILDARELGLIWMCEWLMAYVMSRFQRNRDMCAKKWNAKLCPRIRQLVDKAISHRVGLETLMADKWNWSVEVLSTCDKYAVNLKNRTCGCRRWDLTGIPCRHAMICILENEWNPENFVDEVYHVKTYKKVYAPVVYPINGKSEWVNTGLPRPLPPNEGRAKGRPEKCRRKADDEPICKKRKSRGGGPVAVSSKSKYKLKKEQKTVKCGYCREEGHNSKGCAIRKVNESAGCMLYEVPGKEFSFNNAANMEGTAPADKGKEPKVGGTSKPVTNEGSSFPSMNDQLKQQGVLPKNHSKTINVDGATIHMRNRADNVILGSSVVAMRDKKKAAMKKSKKTDV